MNTKHLPIFSFVAFLFVLEIDTWILQHSIEPFRWIHLSEYTLTTSKYYGLQHKIGHKNSPRNHNPLYSKGFSFNAKMNHDSRGLRLARASKSAFQRTSSLVMSCSPLNKSSEPPITANSVEKVKSPITGRLINVGGPSFQKVKSITE